MLYENLGLLFVGLWTVAAMFVSLGVHEAGHLLAGAALGARGHHVHFGFPDGQDRKQWHLGPVTVHLHDDFFRGGFYKADQMFPATPMRAFLLFLGGPLLCALAFIAVWIPNVSLDWERVLGPLRLWFFWNAVVPLVPWRYGGKYPSDGFGMMLALLAAVVRRRS